MTGSIQVNFLLLLLLSSLGARRHVLAQSNASSSVPLNDQCEEAVAIAPGDFAFASTTDAVVDQDDNQIDLLQCPGDDGIFEIGIPGLWYTYEADTLRVLRLSTCAEETDFPNRITLFSMADCLSRSCDASSIVEDPSCIYGNSTVLEFSTIPGMTYAIFVQNQDSDVSGDFGLSMQDVSPPADNMSCNAAVTLPQNETLQGTTVGASMTSGSLRCDQVVEGGPKNPGVFYYIPPVSVVSGTSLALAGEDVPFEISVYTGSSCDELRCKNNVEIKREGLVLYASWLAEANEDFYLYVFAASTADSENELTDRFGIVMVQEEAPKSEDGSSPAVKNSAMSLLNMLLVACWYAL